MELHRVAVLGLVLTIGACHQKEAPAPEGNAAPLTITSAKVVTPGKVETAGRASFAFVEAPTVSDIGDGPLECVYDGVKFRPAGVSVSTRDDGWRKWRLEISSRPLESGGYTGPGADYLDLYLPQATPERSTPIVFPTNGKDRQGNNMPAQAILQWNDFFGATAKDDQGRDAHVNVLRDGQAYVVVFDHFERATAQKPGRTNVRLFVALKATSDSEKKLRWFREPSGCKGTFQGALVTQ